MAVEERRAWIMLVSAVGAYAVYAAVVLAHRPGVSLVRVSYVPALLWTVGGAVAVQVVLTIAAGVLVPCGERAKDRRDREIHRFGEYVGQSFVVAGAVAALVLAMAGADRFWIANAIYLAFVLSAVLGAGTKLTAYRLGFHPW
ncbi:hypothetical protein [Kitasatospora sp. MAP5-34]|uniref:hypothetical protein n=1 Tax=Kitasatospora sp. MAP5-34 TaxID=3035102 RepID=UPI002475D5B8|nr:hypothetical protein [Kitasatospora sp. MAP5-34]MDH6580856.1 hypothetical protein [Kitasatospora sp. MAP5-34]